MQIWNNNSNNILSYQINGTWTDLSANTVSFTITQVSQPVPYAPVCSPKGTPVNTDQGIVDIDNILYMAGVLAE